jgi:lipopolysaccharide/colanic/teichoic acid biosynthesis glycosyltransferase
MSIVGPRPHPVPLNLEYENIVNGYRLRNLVKPGITGLAQVNGFRGETNSLFLMQQRIDNDLWYIENWSLMLDIKLILLTIFNMIKGDKTAY